MLTSSSAVEEKGNCEGAARADAASERARRRESMTEVVKKQREAGQAAKSACTKGRDRLLADAYRAEKGTGSR